MVATRDADGEGEAKRPDGNRRDPAVERAIELLLCVAGRPTSASLQELTDELRLSKSTVHRLLGRLERIGVVDRDQESRRYRVGSRLYKIIRSAWTEFDPRRIAWPQMEALRALCNETVSLHLLDGTEHVAIETCESPSELRRVLLIGRRIPLCRGATSRALLAFMPWAQAQAILRETCRPGDVPPTAKELEAIRRQGYSVAFGALTPGLTSISTPIFDHRDAIWGALAVSGPSFRLTRARSREIGPLLVEAAARVSQAFGHVPRPESGGETARPARLHARQRAPART